MNCYCKSYLLYSADVIDDRTKSELSNISYAFNSAMCRIYKVKLSSLESDILQDIMVIRKNVVNLLRSNNRVIKHVISIYIVCL